MHSNYFNVQSLSTVEIYLDVNSSALIIRYMNLNVFKPAT